MARWCWWRDSWNNVLCSVSPIPLFHHNDHKPTSPTWNLCAGEKSAQELQPPPNVVSRVLLCSFSTGSTVSLNGQPLLNHTSYKSHQQERNTMYPKQTLNTFSNIAAYAAATENHCAPISVKLLVPSPHLTVTFVKAHNVHSTKCTECTNAIKMERKIIRYVDYEHWELCEQFMMSEHVLAMAQRQW